MANDFTHLKQSGSECVGCGRSSKSVLLMRLRTYSRALCCGACFLKYASCENVNILGVKCHHDPVEHFMKIGPCSMGGCGCPRWIHGLEDDHDRMYAAAVGKAPVSKACHGMGGKACDNVVFADKNGNFPPLCSVHRREFVQNYQKGLEEAKKLIELDETKEVPN